MLCLWLHWITYHLCVDQWRNHLISIKMFLVSSQSGGLVLLILMVHGKFYILEKTLTFWFWFWFLIWKQNSCRIISVVGFSTMELASICCNLKIQRPCQRKQRSILKIIMFPFRYIWWIHCEWTHPIFPKFQLLINYLLCLFSFPFLSFPF